MSSSLKLTRKTCCNAMITHKVPQPVNIDTLIRTETKSGEVVETNLYTISRDYYDEGIDPVANILKEQKTSLIINGRRMA
ncbi:hypothetical protein [Paenibacillus dokdonensis]|uniref:hypothetical protein n=1 Tax=Paenibacillus dokdonensis TaxID=2567944 RepID=UPI001457BE4B|nr:hypothetical protein [Paenibacillus dokdonensis]